MLSAEHRRPRGWARSGHVRPDQARTRSRQACIGVVSAAAVLLLVTGCQRYHDVGAFLPQAEPVGMDQPYTVGSPDVLLVRSSLIPEINNQRIIVMPDGRIELPLLGQVRVSGYTTNQIAAEIRTRALQFYTEADVVVQVTDFRSKHIYVFGEVGRPGRYPYTGSDTVLDLLALAQPSRLADNNRIQVLRPDDEGELVERMTIELNKWIEEGLTDRNALMAEGDILYIPPNGLARVGLAIQQLLLPIQPAAATVAGPADIDNSITSLQGGSSGN